MTSREDQIEAVLRQWNAHQEWLGKDYGPNLDTLREMAAVAVAGLTTARTWSVDDTLPDDVHLVGDECDRKWTRVTKLKGWSCFLPEDQFPAMVGNVYEIVTPTSSAQSTEDEPVCGAANSDYPELRCHLPRGHSMDVGGGHKDRVAGARWGPGVTVHTPKSPAEFVRLEPAAVRGLVNLLSATAAQLTRAHNAYRGAAVKHADELAQQCHATASALVQLAGDPDGPAVNLVDDDGKEDSGE